MAIPSCGGSLSACWGRRDPHYGTNHSARDEFRQGAPIAQPRGRMHCARRTRGNQPKRQISAHDCHRSKSHEIEQHDGSKGTSGPWSTPQTLSITYAKLSRFVIDRSSVQSSEQLPGDRCPRATYSPLRVSSASNRGRCPTARSVRQMPGSGSLNLRSRDRTIGMSFLRNRSEALGRVRSRELLLEPWNVAWLDSHSIFLRFQKPHEMPPPR